MTTDLIFLDTETTGLDSKVHEVWEIAYAVNDGPILTTVVPHSNVTADPKAIAMNGYLDRGNRLPQVSRPDVMIRSVIEGHTLVCANAPFDRGFLHARWGIEPWHYRSIDVESMALLAFLYDRPKGLAGIRTDLVDLGYDIPEPDHSAAGDVRTLREVYKALRQVRRRAL